MHSIVFVWPHSLVTAAPFFLNVTSNNKIKKIAERIQFFKTFLVIFDGTSWPRRKINSK
jgi:hypothetical protein